MPDSLPMEAYLPRAWVSDSAEWRQLCLSASSQWNNPRSHWRCRDITRFGRDVYGIRSHCSKLSERRIYIFSRFRRGNDH